MTNYRKWDEYGNRVWEPVPEDSSADPEIKTNIKTNYVYTDDRTYANYLEGDKFFVCGEQYEVIDGVPVRVCQYKYRLVQTDPDIVDDIRSIREEIKEIKEVIEELQKVNR